MIPCRAERPYRRNMGLPNPPLPPPPPPWGGQTSARPLVGLQLITRWTRAVVTPSRVVASLLAAVIAKTLVNIWRYNHSNVWGTSSGEKHWMSSRRFTQQHSSHRVARCGCKDVSFDGVLNLVDWLWPIPLQVRNITIHVSYYIPQYLFPSIFFHRLRHLSQNCNLWPILPVVSRAFWQNRLVFVASIYNFLHCSSCPPPPPLSLPPLLSFSHLFPSLPLPPSSSPSITLARPSIPCQGEAFITGTLN